MAINKVILSGNLVRDPDLKTIRPGLVACRMTIATNHVTKSPEGEMREEACFIDFTTWNQLAERCAASFSKGSKITLQGRLKMETWTDKKTGDERTKHVIAPEEIIWPEKEEQPQYREPQVPQQEVQRRQQAYTNSYD